MGTPRTSALSAVIGSKEYAVYRADEVKVGDHIVNLVKVTEVRPSRSGEKIVLESERDSEGYAYSPDHEILLQFDI